MVNPTTIISTVQRIRPLVHCITNHVTSNDCANIVLAAGGTPIMADHPEETADISRQSQALVLNLGTPAPHTLQAMLRAGRAANARHIPVIFDPVGVGASPYRLRLAQSLLQTVHMTVIKGNISELRTLFTGKREGCGIEALSAAGQEPAGDADSGQRAVRDPAAARLAEYSAELEAILADVRGWLAEAERLLVAQKFPASAAMEGAMQNTGAQVAGTAGETVQSNVTESVQTTALRALSRSIIIVSGPVDVLVCPKPAGSPIIRLVPNGHPFMSRIIGTGCMASAILATYLGAVHAARRRTSTMQEKLDLIDVYIAAVRAMQAMGLAGEIAAARLERMHKVTLAAAIAASGGVQTGNTGNEVGIAAEAAVEHAGSVGLSVVAIAGTGTYRTLFIDAMSRLRDTDLIARGLCREA